jgi:predicted Zn-dependent peptidase
LVDSIANKSFFAERALLQGPRVVYRQVAQLKADTLKAVYARLQSESLASLVVTGNIHPDQVAQAAYPYASRFVGIEPVGPVPYTPPTQAPPAAYHKLEGQELNYVQGVCRVQEPDFANLLMLELAAQMLEKRLLQELCVRRALTCEVSCTFQYIPDAHFNLRFATRASNVTINAVLDLLAQTARTGFTQPELDEAKARLQFWLAQQLETTQGTTRLVSSALARNQLTPFLRTPQYLSQVRLTDLNKLFRQRFVNLGWVFCGNTANVGRGIFVR